MALGKFTLTGNLPAYDEAPKKASVKIIGKPAVIVDAAGDKVYTAPGRPIQFTGSFSQELVTDVTEGESAAIGYRIIITPHDAETFTVEFWAQPAGTTIDLADITTQVVSPPTPTAASATQVAALDTRVTTLETTPSVTSYNDLTDTPAIPDSPEDVGAEPAGTVAALDAELAPVAKSGTYSDLAGKPAIPSTAADVNAEPAGLSAETEAALAGTFALGVDDVRSVTEGTPAPAPITDMVLCMDRDGALLRSGTTDGTIEKSTDNGDTWATIATGLPRTVIGIRQLDTGELLIGLSGDASTVLASVWLSAGYLTGSPTFSKVIEATDYGKAIELTWGFGGAGQVYAVSEYDTKSPGSRSARQVAWLTEDGGQTWAEIYDHGTGALSRRHIHGVTYDPYRDAVWLVAGDYVTQGDGANFIKVSWDRGATWVTVDEKTQPTAIYCFPDCVVFGNDAPPNGVLRIDNPSPTNLRVRVAYRLNQATSADGGTMVLSHVAQMPFRASTATGHLLLMPFSPVLAGHVGIVLGTYDGFTWFEVWRESGGYKPSRAIGPTPDGTIHLGGQNPNQTGYFTATHDAPAAPGLLSTVTRLSKGVQRAMPKRSVVVWNNESGQSIPTYTTTNITLKTTPTYIEDPSGLFTRAADGSGIVVNRACLVRVNADNGINVANGLKCIARIRLDDVNYKNDTGATVSAVLRVKAGTKVSAAGFLMEAAATTTIGTTALAIEVWEDNAV